MWFTVFKYSTIEKISPEDKGHIWTKRIECCYMKFNWMDFRVGIFYDRAKSYLYVHPIPCIGFVFLKTVQVETITKIN